MYSIYHFFAHLYRNRYLLESVPKLDEFPFDLELLSCSNVGKFPDLAIRINSAGDPPGGELIELKDSRSYTVASFNSTIPTGKKSIDFLTKGKTNVIRQQMEAAGDDIYSLPVRDVYYLLRGKKNNNTKICLVHGSFFETVKVEHLIQQAFNQVLEERLADSNDPLNDDLRKLILNIFSRQDSFSKVRHVENASVKLRFRIMTEVKKEGNILSSQSYPAIKDNTINLIIPHHTFTEFTSISVHLQRALSQSELLTGQKFVIRHPFNGEFFVLSFLL